LTLVTAFSCLLVVELFSEYITEEETYYQDNSWLLSVALFFAAICNFFLSKALDRFEYRKRVKKLEKVDAKDVKNTFYSLESTKTEKVLYNPMDYMMLHTFWLIPVKLWSLIYLGVAIVNLLVSLNTVST